MTIDNNIDEEIRKFQARWEEEVESNGLLQNYSNASILFVSTDTFGYLRDYLDVFKESFFFPAFRDGKKLSENAVRKLENVACRKDRNSSGSQCSLAITNYYQGNNITIPLTKDEKVGNYILIKEGEVFLNTAESAIIKNQPSRFDQVTSKKHLEHINNWLKDVYNNKDIFADWYKLNKDWFITFFKNHTFNPFENSNKLKKAIEEYRNKGELHKDFQKRIRFNPGLELEICTRSLLFFEVGEFLSERIGHWEVCVISAWEKSPSSQDIPHIKQLFCNTLYGPIHYFRKEIEGNSRLIFEITKNRIDKAFKNETRKKEIVNLSKKFKRDKKKLEAYENRRKFIRFKKNNKVTLLIARRWNSADPAYPIAGIEEIPTGKFNEPNSAKSTQVLTMPGTTWPLPQRARVGGGYFLIVNGTGIVIDPGYYFLDILFINHGFTIKNIDIVIVTHDHPDHHADLLRLLNLAHRFSKKGKSSRRKEIKIFLSASANIIYGNLISAGAMKSIAQSYEIKEAKNHLPSGIELSLIEGRHKNISDSIVTYGLVFSINMDKGQDFKIGITGDTYFKTLEEAKPQLEGYKGCDILVAHWGGLEDDWENLTKNIIPSKIAYKQQYGHLGLNGCIHLFSYVKPKIAGFITEFGMEALNAKKTITKIISQVSSCPNIYPADINTDIAILTGRRIATLVKCRCGKFVPIDYLDYEETRDGGIIYKPAVTDNCDEAPSYHRDIQRPRIKTP